MPPKLVPVLDLSEHAPYRGAYGGRGSGKTRSFALAAAIKAWLLAQSGQSGVVLCGREFMNSLDDSSMAEIKMAIEELPWLAAQYDCGEKYIRTRDGRIRFVFTGLRHSLNAVKSKARVLLTWIDEAEDVSEAAWVKLLPTVQREPNAEVWVTWNPERDGSPTDERFIKHPPVGSRIVQVNHDDNPWFPPGLEARRLEDQKRLDAGTYAWIWEGAYRQQSDAQILAGCFEVAEFVPAKDWGGPYQGLDWGFAQDPTAAIRAWVHDDCLFIEHEAGGVGVELDATPALLRQIPDFADYVTRADSARPESIRHVNRHGMRRVEAVKKWKGSVEDGIAHIKAYRRVIIHPRCKATIGEFRAYRYKVDRLSGDVLPTIADADNHYIDALRYALQPVISGKDYRQRFAAMAE